MASAGSSDGAAVATPKKGTDSSLDDEMLAMEAMLESPSSVASASTKASKVMGTKGDKQKAM